MARTVMWPKAEVKLSGVLPSWSRLRRRFALRRRATRLETGGGELPGLPQCFLGGSCAGVTCCAVCAGCQPVGAGAGRCPLRGWLRPRGVLGALRGM